MRAGDLLRWMPPGWSGLFGLPGACLLGACGSQGEVWSHEPVATRLDGPVVCTLIEGMIPRVEVELDGHTAVLAVDYGADGTLLDEGFVERAGFELVPLKNRVTSSRDGEVVRVYEHFTRVAELRLGEALATELQPLVVDLSHLLVEVDGVLGVDVLIHWTVVFDDEADELRILPSGDLGAALAGVYSPGSEFHCLDWYEPDPRPRLLLEFENDVSFPVVLDTGAVLGTFPRGAVEALDLERVGTTTSAHIGGKSERELYRVSRLELVEAAFTDFEVQAEDDEDGYLGYAMLRNCVFVMDGPARTFCFAFHPGRED